MAQQIEPRSDNPISRLNDRLDEWSQRHLPDWLYKGLTGHPGRLLAPGDPKAVQAVCWVIIAIAGIALVLLLLN